MEEINTELPGTEDETVSGNDPGTQEPDEGNNEMPEQPDMSQDSDQKDEPGVAGTDQEERHEENGQEFDRQQVEDALNDVLARLKEPDRTDELTQRLDEMIELLTPEETEDVVPERSQLSIPSSDYTEWDYPVKTVYGITTRTGYSTYVSMVYDSADAFNADFEKMQTDVIEGNLQSFYVRYVYGIGDDDNYSVLLYDSENPVTVPEEPEDTTVTDLLLSHLEGINTYLSDMQAADLEYYQAMADYREEMLELQTADTASTVILCVAVFMVSAQLLFSELFRRLK